MVHKQPSTGGFSAPSSQGSKQKERRNAVPVLSQLFLVRDKRRKDSDSRVRVC